MAGSFAVVAGGECRYRGHGAFCALCNRGDLRGLTERLQARIELAKSEDPTQRARAKRWRHMLRRLRIRIYTTCYDPIGHVRRLYDIDHVLPICEGGPNHPTNLRILCLPCHKHETAMLAARRAERRLLETGAN